MFKPFVLLGIYLENFCTMRTLTLLVCFFLLSIGKPNAQTYFPPLTGTVWDTIAPQSLGWCQDSIDNMYNWLGNTTTKAFIVLKDGKIVLEKYFGTFTADSVYVWNSAGKTLTAYAVGIAQKEGYLSIDDTTSQYLGSGWTSLTTAQEQAITIRHQLTMTSGLDDGVSDMFCTDPSCLQYLTAPGTRWAYHNAPYTLLDGVIENATGTALNSWVQTKIGNKIGMYGMYIPVDYNNIYISKPRSMARFGLLLSQDGYWDGTEVLNDLTYLNAMRTPSQSLNNSYGYLTWLNGQSSFMIPQSQFVFPGFLCPNAPADMYAAEGKNAQIINVVPSQGIVLIRMGSTMGTSLVGTQYNDTIWQYMNRLQCSLSVTETEMDRMALYPNPSTDWVSISDLRETDLVRFFDQYGKELFVNRVNNSFSIGHLASGVYFIKINRFDQEITLRLLQN